MKKFISFILVTMLALSFMAISVNAQCSLSVSSSKKEVLVGNNVTVTFTFSASAPVESADVIVQFDNARFQYVSVSGGLGNLMTNAQGKTIKISDYGSSATSKTYKFTMTFKALTVGSGTFTVTSSDIGDANFESLGSPTGSTTVSVKEESKSNNANLSSLTVPSGCKLVPAFNKNTTSYTCTVPYEVTKFPMDWTTEDKDAKTEVTALQTLKVGENSRTVTVTAADGTKKAYTVKVIREAQKVTPTPTPTPTQKPTTSSKATPTPTPTPTATVTPTPTSAPIIAVVDGTQYSIKDKITLQIPENFKKETYKYHTNDIETAVLGDVCLVQLFDGSRDRFFVYDKVTEDFSHYRTVTMVENNLVILDKKPEVNIELTEKHIVIGDGEYICWTNEKLGEGYYLLNVMNKDGKTYPALYCKEDGSIQKLSISLVENNGASTSEPQTTPEPTPIIETTPEATPDVIATPLPQATETANNIQSDNENQEKEGFFDKIPMEFIGIIVCAILLIIIIIIVIVIIVSNHKDKQNQHDWGFEDEQASTGFDFTVEEVGNRPPDDDEDFE